MGLNIPHLFYIQEIAHIKDIIFHSFNLTLTGRLYITSMELLFIELGLDPQHHIKDRTLIETLTTPSLFQATLLFMASYNIQLKHSILIQPQREYDQFIMAVFVSLQTPTSDLIACNHCRLYLQACLVSDITTGDGTTITEEAWAGHHRPPAPRRLQTGPRRRFLPCPAHRRFRPQNGACEDPQEPRILTPRSSPESAPADWLHNGDHEWLL